jgi:hypothetical protein
MTNIINGVSGTYPAVNPIFTGGYVFSQEDIPGVAAANNYLSLENPTGSGKVIVLAGVFISSFILADIATTSVSMRGYLATGISGGVTHAVNTIGKVRSSMPNPAGVIRDTNPTATLGAPWFNSPPVIGASKGSSPFVHQIPATIAAGSITLLPGEGTVIRQESGDVDARWNISIAWSEF